MLQNQQEHEEIAALKDSPSTLWALPFLSGPETASALTQMESQPISPKSLSAPSMGMSKQPVPETKLLADESTEVSARASAELHRATAPAGPCTISAKQTPQQKASASQSFHVTAYQPTVTSTDHMLSVSNGAIPGESQMDGQRGAAAQSKDGEVRAGGMSDGIQIKQAAMNSSSALQSAVHDGKPDSQELLADAGGSIQQAKGSAVCADRSDAGEPAQSRKRASQAQTADEQHPSAASSPSDHAPLPAGTASDSLHVSEQPVNGHAGPSKHVAEAAQGSKAAAQHLLQSASKKGGRDEQQVAGPTRSGSPADTSEPPARDKSQAADVQAGGAAKQARARRTIQAASTAMTATEDVLPSKQNKQQQSQTAGEVEQSSAQQPALSGKQASKWQKQPASAQEEPTLRKRQKVSEAVPQNKSAGGSKAADAGQTKSQRSSKDAPADERQPDVRCDLPSQTMHNIYDSLKQLGLLQNQWRKGELTRQHIYELDCHAPLVQLHTLAQYGSKFEPRGDPVKFLDICTNNMVKLHANTTWLAHRLYNLGFQYKLSPDALSLQQRLVALRMLPKDAVPELAAQVLPVELQPAYVLALGGYQGNRLPRFAQTLLHSILWQVCWTLHQCPSSSQNFKVALNKYELATGRPFKLATDPAGKAKDPQKPNRSSAGTDTATALATAGTTGASAAQTAKHGNTGKRKHSPIPIPGSAAATAAAASLAEQTQTAVSHRSPDGRSSSVTDKPTQHCSQADSVKLKKPKKSVQLSIGQVADTAFKGLVKLGKMQADSLDELSLDFLRKQSHLWQLRILSLFSQRVRMGRASAFLTSLCKANRIEAGQGDLRWAQPAEQIENYALGLLHLACRAGLVSKDLGSTDVFKAIPADLHSVAVCYAIGSCSGASGVTAQQHSSTSHALQKATGQASSALHTFVQYTQQLMEREGLNCPPFAPPQATRPTRPHTAPPASAQYPSYPSLQAQNSFPSFDRPSSLHQTSRPHQQQAHNNLEDYDKPCPDYYRATGSCDKQDCPYLHGSHDEYVAYVQRLGLIPYGLKFHSQVGRDRWVADAAVDVLNDMMKRNIISRGSFSGRDLQPLAFLDDPVNGNHAQLQLQVSLFLHD